MDLAVPQRCSGKHGKIVRYSPESHSQCLLCGEDNPWSLRLDFKVIDEGEVGAVFQAHEKLQGYAGILHGGVISALLDSAMAHCLFHQGIQGLTAELRVRFLKPMPWETPIELRAKLDESRPPLYQVKAELKQKGILVAKAQAKFFNHSLFNPNRGGVTK